MRTKMLKTSLEKRWTTLHPDSLKPVFQLVDSAHSLEFYIGCDSEGKRQLLLVTGTHAEILKQMKAVRIDFFEREDGRWSLLIRLAIDEFASIFALLCEDLIEASRDISSSSTPADFVISRILQWQRLLERSGAGLLSPSEVRGLAGELIFLKTRMVPEFGEFEAVAAWSGPTGADQDFRLPHKAWEIKTIHPDSPGIKVASEMQLYSSTRTINLVVITLTDCAADSEDTYSLNDVVDLIRKHLESDVPALEAFELRMTVAGYVRRPEYDRLRFRINAIDEYSIQEGFPRIIEPQLPVGVTDVVYGISLSACKPFQINSYSVLL